MDTQRTTDRLAEIEKIHGPAEPGTKERMLELLAAADNVEIDHPDAIFGDGDGGLHAIWQSSTGRATVYADADGFDIDVVPHGPLRPFRASTAEEAAAYLRGLATTF